MRTSLITPSRVAALISGELLAYFQQIEYVQVELGNELALGSPNNYFQFLW